jgi:hypothetical protein
MSLMLDPDSKPSPSQAIAPSTACSSAIGSEVRLSVSAERWIESACKLGSRCRFIEGSADLVGRGKRVSASVHSRLISENDKSVFLPNGRSP